MYIAHYSCVIIIDIRIRRDAILLNCNGSKPLLDLYMKQHICQLFISLIFKPLSLLNKFLEPEFHLEKVMTLKTFLLTK